MLPRFGSSALGSADAAAECADGPEQGPHCVSVHGPFHLLPGRIEKVLWERFAEFGAVAGVTMGGADLARQRANNVFARLYKVEKLGVLGRSTGDPEALAQSHGELCEQFARFPEGQQTERLRGWLKGRDSYTCMTEAAGKRRAQLEKMLWAPGCSEYAVIRFQSSTSCARVVRHASKHQGIEMRRSAQSAAGAPRVYRVAVHLHDTLESVRGELAQKPWYEFNAGDLLDQHTLDKVLMFLWSNRDELLPETAGEEFTTEQWGNAWRSVLARKLRAADEKDWITAFCEAFPCNDADFSHYPMQLPGLRPAPELWLGESDGGPPWSCSLVERIMLLEAEKLFTQAGKMLDISHDHTITRDELATFFGTRAAGDREERYVVRTSPEPRVTLPYREESEKLRAVQAEETRELSARMTAIQQRCAQEQRHVCALHMSKAQYADLLLQLCPEGSNTQQLSLVQKRQPMAEAAKKRRKRRTMQGGVGDSGGVLNAEELVHCARDMTSTGRTVRRHDGKALSAGKEANDRDKDKGKDIEEVIDHLLKGEFGRVHYGLSKEKQAQLLAQYGRDREHGPDEELLKASAMIVSESSELRLRSKAHENCPGVKAEELFNTMIREQPFLDAYHKATGVDLAKRAVWKKLSGKFGGMIPKETLLRYCRTFPTRGLDTGIGGAVYTSFSRDMYERSITSLNVLVFLVFALMFVLTVLSDRGLNLGFYQQLAVREFLSKELGGSENPGDPSTWFPWTFEDIAEEDEYWEFVSNVLDFVYPGEGRTGVYRSVGLSNNVVGGFKLHQYRVAPRDCSGLSGLFDNNVERECDRKVVPEDWGQPRPAALPAEYANCSDGVCVYHLIPRNKTKYMDDFPRDRTVPRCLADTPRTAFNSSVRVAVFPWTSVRIMAEVFKWLAEEELGVRVQIVETTPAKALGSMALPRVAESVDVVLEAWGWFRQTAVERALKGDAVLAGDLGVPGRAGLYTNPRAIAACPWCAKYQAFAEADTVRVFSCNCSTPQPPRAPWEQGHCTAYACTHNCSRCTLPDSDAAADWCGNCSGSPRGFGASCNPAAGCDTSRGAVWDVHPSHGIASLGPELWRSKQLRLHEHLQLLFTRSSDELQRRVEAASGLRGPDTARGPMLWFWYEPDPLVPLVKAKRVQLPAYNKKDCPLPDPVLDDPEMRTEYHCDIRDQPLLKLARKEVPDELPTVFKLLSSMQFSAEDLDKLMLQKERDPTIGYDEVACGWLKANREKWVHWLPHRTVRERKMAFYEHCFPNWPGGTLNNGRGNDESSFTKHADALVREADAQSSELRANRGRKQLKGRGPDLDLPAGASAFDEIERDAGEGNVSAQALWWRFRPWMYQECSLPFHGLMYGSVLDSSFSRNTLYNCDGYIAFFPLSWTKFRAQQQVEELKSNNWIDIATRGILMEVFTYSQNTGLLVRTRYFAELSSTGGWWKSKQFTVFSLWQDAADSWFSLVSRFIPMLLTSLYFLYSAVARLYYGCRQSADARRQDATAGHNLLWPPLVSHRCYCYLLRNVTSAIYTAVQNNPGDLFDMGFYGCVWYSWGLRFYIIKSEMTHVNILCGSQYPDGLTFVADLWLLLDKSEAAIAVLVFFRFIYFLRVVHSMDDIIETVHRAALNIFWLMVAFAIMTCGFTLSAWVVFGNLIDHYSGFTRTFTSLLFVILGEHDFVLFDAHRPDFAFLFFFVYFVVVICVLFNLIIAVVGNAYNEVASQRLDVTAFIARVLHDPETCTWAPLEMGRSAEWNSVRNLFYCRRRCPGLRFRCPAKHAASAGKGEGAYRQRRRRAKLMRNPSIFWWKYTQVLQDLASGDLIAVLRAHAKVRLLMESAHVRQHVPECPYEHGDHVYVRDGPADVWRKGIVESTVGAEPLIRPCGWRQPFAWREITVDRGRFRDPDGEDAQLVRLLCPLQIGDPADDIQLDPETCGPGEVLKAFHMPPGTPPWKQDFVGVVRFPQVGNLKFNAPRIAVEPLTREIAPEREEGDRRQEDVELLRVSDFLDSEFGKVQRPVVDFFLTKLPAEVLGINRTGLWIMLLRHYSRWKRVTSAYTKFGRTSEDMLGDLHERMLEKAQQRQEQVEQSSPHSLGQSMMEEASMSMTGLSALAGGRSRLGASPGPSAIIRPPPSPAGAATPLASAFHPDGAQISLKSRPDQQGSDGEASGGKAVTFSQLGGPEEPEGTRLDGAEPLLLHTLTPDLGALRLDASSGSARRAEQPRQPHRMRIVLRQQPQEHPLLPSRGRTSSAESRPPRRPEAEAAECGPLTPLLAALPVQGSGVDGSPAPRVKFSEGTLRYLYPVTQSI